MTALDSTTERRPVAESAALLAPGPASRSPLDLHRVTQFATVAKHLNITRAASELYLTQQAVSASIKSLERDLGVNLFTRAGKRLELTSSGIVLREGAAPLLDAASALTRRIHAAQTSQKQPLTVAFTSEVIADDLADLSITAVEVLPETAIVLRQIAFEELHTELRSGRADIALTRSRADDDHLASTVIARTPITVALAREHRLADCDGIAFSELANDTLILPRDVNSPHAHFLVAICHQAGLEPSTATANFQGITPTAAVIGTPYYALVTAAPGLYHRGQVAVITASPAPLAPLQAHWLPHTHNPLRRTLLDAHRARHNNAESFGSTIPSR
ncbi:DNA-binding transcriptional LysR family regulator [Rhodococcus sp. OAS809]|uniref:LysR family transcriptional regulator n=1 Tax=Rhodococcus TaxID=1827 RepID=UPI0002FCE081|nr:MULTISPECIES: LysR family transcriptional regulator [Rhodococcus]OQM78131.1 HTH-type transcriptional regulator CynR [Rhodococcus sp. 66b]